jgi:hypothetical protein
VPPKKETITDAERAKRVRETAREIGADATREQFERAFKKIVPPKQQKRKSVTGRERED